MRPIVTLICQTNVLASFERLHASIWVARGDTTTDDEGPYPEENPDAYRFCGPVDFEVASQTSRTLTLLLEFLGFDVKTEMYPDD